MAAFPAFKLGVLLFKQLSKPLAKVIVSQAKQHPFFRTYFIIPPAQFYHWAEVKGKMYLMNLGKPSKVAKLNEQMAIELGANLLGEVLIFSIAGGLLLFEYNRQSLKEAKKEEVRQAQVQKFTDDLNALNETSQQYEKQIEYLKIIVKEIAAKTDHKVDLDKLKPLGATQNDDKQTDDNIKIGNQSFVHRAINYFEKNVKGINKVS